MIVIACQMAKNARDRYPQKNIQIAFSVPPVASYRPDVLLASREEARKIYEFILEPSLNMNFIDFYLC